MLKKIHLIEELICGFFLFTLAFVPFFEVILRRLTGSGLVWSSGLVNHTVVWVAWMGGMLASREQVHLSLSTGTEKTGGLRRYVSVLQAIGVSSVNMAFAVASASFLVLGFAPGKKIGIIPIRLVLIILPLGYLVMSIRSLTIPKRKPSWLIALGLVLGLFFSWPSLVNLLGTVFMDLPFTLYNSVDSWYGLFIWLRWPIILGLIGLGGTGLPLYIVLGGTALFLFSGNYGALESLPNEAYNLLSGNMIPAIPLFTIAGFILSESQSGKRLIRFFQASLGWLPGGLAVVAVVACAYFTTFTGASGVTILALGGLLSSVLIDSKHYGKDFSRGLVTASGSVGLLFPPSLPIIMYGVTAQISILEMFLGGLLPGTLLVLALAGMGILRAIKVKREKVPFVFREFLGAVKHAAGDLMLPIVLLGAYFGGLTNVVETASLAVVYTLALITVTGELKMALLGRVVKRGVSVVGGILVILAAAKGLSYYIVDAQIPTILTAFFRDHISSKFVFLLLLNIALLITGTLMDIYSAILVVAPLIIPLGELYGVHPVQLGVIFLANLQLGYLTPPVGMNLFLASYTFNQPLTKVYRQVVPFLLILLVGVLLITYIPWFSLALIG